MCFGIASSAWHLRAHAFGQSCGGLAGRRGQRDAQRCDRACASPASAVQQPSHHAVRLAGAGAAGDQLQAIRPRARATSSRAPAAARIRNSGADRHGPADRAPAAHCASSPSHRRRTGRRPPRCRATAFARIRSRANAARRRCLPDFPTMPARRRAATRCGHRRSRARPARRPAPTSGAESGNARDTSSPSAASARRNRPLRASACRSRLMRPLRRVEQRIHRLDQRARRTVAMHAAALAQIADEQVIRLADVRVVVVIRQHLAQPAVQRQRVEQPLQVVVVRGDRIAQRSRVVSRQQVGLPVDQVVAAVVFEHQVDDAGQQAVQARRAETAAPALVAVRVQQFVQCVHA